MREGNSPKELKMKDIQNVTIYDWIEKAINFIASGLAQKLEKDGVKVYSCGKIIRIDIPAAGKGKQ